jgi:hypothetical protein
MNRILLLALLMSISLAVAKPVEKEGEEVKSQAEIRASLITKHNVMEYLVPIL